MRGEYPTILVHEGPLMELPPRARRIPHDSRARGSPNGTTSACAENTRKRSLRVFIPWNYLRVRGEYIHGFFAYLTV